jgi:hypothetical protein
MRRTDAPFSSQDVRDEIQEFLIWEHRYKHETTLAMLEDYAKRLHQDEFGRCRPDEGFHDWPGMNCMFLGAKCSCGQRRIEEVNGVKLSDILPQREGEGL